MAGSFYQSLQRMQPAPTARQTPVQQKNPLGNFTGIMRAIQSGGNPVALLRTMGANNPGAQEAATFLERSGGDAKAAFYAMAKQKGVDPNAVLNQIRGLM